jgi:S-adenosylmethionine decarboxylase
MERNRDEALKVFLQNLLDSVLIAFMWGTSRLLVGSCGLIGRLSLSVAPARRHLGFLSLVGEDGMSQNALLRSVKGLGIPDLGIPGTARTEDKKIKNKLKVAVPAPEEAGQDFASQEFASQEFASKDHFAVRKGVRCAGVHLIIDLHGAKRLNDIEHIEATLRRCVAAARATLLHIHLHHFQPGGVSGVAAESHISIHTWPEAGYAALDVFMCGTAEPDKCIPVLREAFAAERVGVNELLRGQTA